MTEEWTFDDMLQASQGVQDPSSPSRHKVSAKDSKAYIRGPEDLIAYRGLYNALKPYREKYKWWQYQFLCHLVLCSVHDIAIHGNPPGVPIPSNALIKSLPSMRKKHLEELIQDGLISRDHYNQINHQCYWYFMGERLAEQVHDAYCSRSLLDMLLDGVCSLETGRRPNPLKTILYTKGKNGTKGQHEPSLIQQSFGMIRHNCVNIWKLHQAFEQLTAEIDQCPHPAQKQKLKYRYIGNTYCRA